MTRDELEFAVSQYHDGTLSPLERDRVDEILAASAEARMLLAELRRIDAAVRRAPALPELNWEKVHARFAGAVSECEEAPIASSFRIGRVGWIGAALAAAAAVVVVVSLSGRDAGTSQRPGTIQVAVGPVGSVSQPSGSNQVTIGGANVAGTVAPGNLVAQVSIGPGPAVAAQAWRYQDTAIVRPARVIIAAGGEPAQDGGPNPF